MGCVMKMYRDWQVRKKNIHEKKRFNIFFNSYQAMMSF
jgi:hypothetical protein